MRMQEICDVRHVNVFYTLQIVGLASISFSEVAFNVIRHGIESKLHGS